MICVHHNSLSLIPNHHRRRRRGYCCRHRHYHHSQHYLYRDLFSWLLDHAYILQHLVFDPIILFLHVHLPSLVVLPICLSVCLSV